MSQGRRALPFVLVAVLGASLALPAAAEGGPPAEPTQQVLIQGDDAIVVWELTDDQLTELRADPDVGSVVTRGRTAQTALAQSVPKVGAPSVWGGGQRGAGKVIVVIDTGVASNFGGTLVGQACFAATQVVGELLGHCGPSEDETQAFDSTCFDLGVCSDGVPGDVFDPAAGRPCSDPAVPADCAHGTAVAAVAARHEPTPGVAPDAGVYAIRVFRPDGAEADLVDILLALDHVRQLSDAGLDIAAVNLSLSTPVPPPSCDADSLFFGANFRAVFDQLRARRIASVVAAGNDFRAGSVGFPACVSSAVSVGATDLDDELADFGNRGPGLDLVAPGADEGNGVGNGMDIPGSPVAEWSGTSFSAPHVAGAFALLEPQYPKASVNQLVAFLYDAGVPVPDPATGASYRRLRLGSPAQVLKAGLLFPTSLAIAGTTRSAIGDFDGDGLVDVVAHGPGSAPDRISYGRTTWGLTVTSRTVSGTFTPLAGNFRGAVDSPDDIFWYAPGAAGDYLWRGVPDRSFASASVAVNGTFTPHVGDFNGDGWDDIFWFAAGAAADYVWYGGVTAFTSRAATANGPTRVAVGDVNGDGRDDLFLHGPGAAADAIWRGTATGTFLKRSLSISGSYTVLAGDINGDARDDVVLYRPGSGTDYIWRGGPGVGSAGATGGFSQMGITVNGTYTPAIGDVDGDARDDIIWYAAGPAADAIWLGRATGLPSPRSISVSGSYRLLVGDLDADGGEELVWFSATSITTPVWWSHTAP